MEENKFEENDVNENNAEENNVEENNVEANNAEANNAEENNVEENNAEENNVEENNVEENNVGKSKKRKFSVKKIKMLVAIILLVAMVGALGATVYANFIAMPNPITTLAKTMGKKYKLDTKFDFGKLDKKGKFLVEANFAEDNVLNFPDGKIALSASYKKNQVGITANVLDEQATVNLSKKDMAIAASIKGLNDGKAYGLSLKDFKEKLDKSVFGPDSDSQYAIREESVVDLLCSSVETVAGLLGDKSKETKQTEKDFETLSNFLMKTFKKSKLGKTEKNYFSLEVLGEKRAARNKTYTVNQDTLDDFLDLLYKNMRDSKKKVSEAGDRLCEKLTEPLSDYLPEASDIDWDWLTEQLGEIKDEIDIGDLEIKITVAYKFTNISAIIIEVESEDMDLEGTLTLDLGKNPVKNMDTVIDLDASYSNVEIKGRITVEDNSEKLVNDITVKGEFEAGPEMKYSAKARLVLDTKAEKASLKVEYSPKGSFSEMEPLLDLKCKYVDTKDEWSLAFESVTIADDEPIKADDLGIDIKLAFYREPDDTYKMPEYEDVLAWDDDSDVEDFADKIMELIHSIAGKYDGLFDGYQESPSGFIPHDDPDMAAAALREHGYTVSVDNFDEPSEEGIVATVMGEKTETDFVNIAYYKDGSSASADFDSAQEVADMIEDFYGVDIFCDVYRDMVYVGTIDAIYAAGN